jgi:DNA repair exonuclease SbcCD ATPase subunit
MSETTNTQKEIEKLQKQIHTGAEETLSYLESLKAKLAEYDNYFKVSETATGYLQSGIDKVHASVEDLKEVGGKIKTSTKSTSDAWVESTHASLQRVRGALEELKQRAIAYDEKVKGKVYAGVGAVKGTVVAAKDTTSSSIEGIVNLTRQRANDSIELASSQLQRVKDVISKSAVSAAHSAFVVAGGAITKAEELDAQYGVRTSITGTVQSVTEKVIDLDKKLGVSETALKIDEKVMGGIGASLVNRGVEIAHQGVEYVTQTITQAKAAATEEEAAKSPKALAPAAPAAPAPV